MSKKTSTTYTPSAELAAALAKMNQTDEVLPLDLTSPLDALTSVGADQRAKMRDMARNMNITAAGGKLSKIATDKPAMRQIAATYDLLAYAPDLQNAQKAVAALLADREILTSKLDAANKQITNLKAEIKGNNKVRDELAALKKRVSILLEYVDSDSVETIVNGQAELLADNERILRTALAQVTRDRAKVSKAKEAIEG